MVTFTKAAVAELEERIRLFIRSAYKVSMGETIKDETITAIVAGCSDQAEASRLLHEAVLFLDETSVLTIHSFCQKTLNEFAFETNHLFGAETLKDTGLIIETEINKFWRKQVTSIPVELLTQFITDGLSIKSLVAVVKEHLSGKKYASFNPEKDYTLGIDDYNDFIMQYDLLRKECDQMKNNVIKYLIENANHLKSVSADDRYAKKAMLPLVDSPAELLANIVAKRGSGYVQNLYADVLKKSDECESEIKLNKEKAGQIVSSLICFAIQQSMHGIETYKQRNNQMSFDDMIVKLHEALVINENGSLIEELQKKYKAVFVDEFQDTDRLQYELFQAAFNTNTIVFYIGDPKQSIFAWRKADIFTYFKAYGSVDTIYEMNENFRSSAAMIEAMNIFFEPVPGFDTFFFKEASDAIKYIPVDSPAFNKKGLMNNNGKSLIPISITKLPNNDSIDNAVAAQIIDLLENKEYKIGNPNDEKNIKPTDIGVLVKTNKQGRRVKNILARFGIPAVTIGDDKVLQSDEAKYLLYLLEAINEITRASIYKALLSPFTGFSKEKILQLDDDITTGLFKKYKARWEQDGIYTALKDFVADFNMQQILLEHNLENGERTVTNLYHLMELMHKVQTIKLLSPLELISWLKRAVEGMEIEGDEYEQRVENDEEAVKIVTIHKSKGLEYKIVLAPFLDLMTINEHDMAAFRDPASGEYISVEKKCLTNLQQEIWKEQQEQENRRLIYVAITRAVYKCYLYKNIGNRGEYNFNNSSLSAFTDALVNASPSLILQTDEALKIDEKYRYTTSAPWAPLTEIKEVHFSLTQQNWTKMSYTMLSAKHDATIKNTSTKHEDEYNKFVFHQLAKGEKTGNLLHAILETIHYSNSERWNSIIETAITRFAPGQRLLYEKMLPPMLQQILEATIQLPENSFKLADVAFNKRIHEFEFDFPVASFSTDELNDFSDENIQVNVKTLGKLEGIMNGKIDLFFEHDGKYFILDWKSNFLGDALEDYAATGVANAMNENNYHLQYLIYTVAVKKYLESRLPGFDYERDFGGVIYLFLRGVRADSDSGIFLHRPALNLIETLTDRLSEPALEAY